LTREQDKEGEQEKYRRVDQRYWKYERTSPRRTTKRDQRECGQERIQEEHKQERDQCEWGQERNHFSYRDSNYKPNSKKHYKSDWNQPLRHKITRPSQFPTSSTIHTHHVATLNQHPQRQSRSPDHRV